MKKLIVICLLLATAGSRAQDKRLQDRLDTLMRLYEQEKYFSGVVMVSQKGKVLYQKAIGYADKEKAIPNRIGTNFNIASAGKTFTAVMVMQLVQEGRIRLTDTLARLLPHYNLKNAERITVRQLLTHTSGINNYMIHPSFESARHTLKSLRDVMPLVAGMPPTLDTPGQRYDYSNSGFIVLGRIIEEITGKDYITNLRERIFRKAGIVNSYIHHPATFTAPAEAVPYFIFSQKSYKNGMSEEFPAFSDGGMQSNAPDLTRFANALLQGKLLNNDARTELWTGITTMHRSGKYALGWVHDDNPYNRHIVSHSGGGKGFSSDLKISVEDQYVIAVLINNRQNPREISNNILKLLYTGTYDKPEKPLANAAFERIEEKGWETVKDGFNTLFTDRKLEKAPSVWFYIDLMEMLAETGRAPIAFEVLGMATKAFPKEPAPYNVAAQISLQNGNKEAARQYYRKALETDPEDVFAKNGLKNIE